MKLSGALARTSGSAADRHPSTGPPFFSTSRAPAVAHSGRPGSFAPARAGCGGSRRRGGGRGRQDSGSLRRALIDARRASRRTGGPAQAAFAATQNRPSGETSGLRRAGETEMKACQGLAVFCWSGGETGSRVPVGGEVFVASDRRITSVGGGLDAAGPALYRFWPPGAGGPP